MDDDDVNFFGTAFDKLESHETVSKRPEIDQTVRDERGRRRFHGAFTGGFSAGYWNTVGSAEGFTPQIFKSSRKNKYESSSSSKPEDFMDEEDFSAYGIAPKKVHTTDDFVDNLQFAGIRGNTFDDAVRSVFSSSQESIGKRLFRKMKFSARLEKKIKYGHEILVNESERQSRVEIVKYQDVDFKCKDNFHGIGYSGAIDANKFLFKPKELTGKDSLNNKQNTIQTTISGGKKLKISGEAFGVGALEEDDDYGGMSVYFNEDMSQYDFELGKKEEKEPAKKKRKFRDTQNVDPNKVGLESFRKSSKGVTLFNELRRCYRLPEIPRNWKPKRIAKVSSDLKLSRWDAKTSEPVPVASESKSRTEVKSSTKTPLTANVRAALIGEEVVYQTGVLKKSTAPTFVSPVSTSIQAKPLTGILASKFTSSNPSSTFSTSNPDDVQLTAGLSTFAQVSSQNEAFITKSRNDNLAVDDSKLEPPVRLVFEWHPHRLLCKRFGLKDPFVNNPHVGIVGSYDSVLKLHQLQKQQKQQASSSTLNEQSNSSQKSEKKVYTNLFQNLNEVNDYYSSENDPSQLDSKFDRFKMEKEKPKSVPEAKDPEVGILYTTPKATIQALKSVFASDEEDLHSGDDDDDEDGTELEDDKEIAPKHEMPANKQKSGGLFSGIDFNAVNAQQFNDTGDYLFQSRKRSAQNDHDKDDDDDDDDDDNNVYGPVMPTAVPSFQKMDHKSESDKSSKKKKLKRKDKKEKKSKKKSKKKEKKRKEKKHKHSRRASSSSSSSSPSYSSDDDNHRHGRHDDSNITTDLDSQIMAFIKQAREQAS